VLLAGCGRESPQVTLYCSQDREFAEGVFEDFTRDTGLAILPSYDTEADKSVSLFLRIVEESSRPRCDVFWNNEILATIRLQQRGLLEPYASPAAAAFPNSCKASNDTWHAFAARARVLIVNTQMVPEADRPKSLLDLALPRWRGRCAMAKPNHGMSATQAACLFEVMGTDAAKTYYRALRENQIHIVPGNKQAAEGVGAGRFAVAVTDSDDALAEVAAGRPVALVFPDRDGHPQYPRLGTLYVPNTLAILRGGPHAEASRRLVDFLLRPDVEKRLAESAGHQIPLNPKVIANLPPELERPRGSGGTVTAMDVDFVRAAGLWDEVQKFLRDEFARP
jgi:iron(III) transport system substrate-binding protein